MVVDLIMLQETRNAYDNSASINYLHKELYAMGPKLGTLETDPDIWQSITRIYVEAGEAWVVLIAHEPERYEFNVRPIAQCTEYNDKDLEVTKITFNFWYELTQLITLDKHRLFLQLYPALLDNMVSHLHCPVEKGDRTDIFRDFRHEMGDVPNGLARLGEEHLLVCSTLRDRQGGLFVRCREVDAPLFNMRMMAREVETEEAEVIKLFAPLSVMKDHKKVAGTIPIPLILMTDFVTFLTIFMHAITSYVEATRRHPAFRLFSGLWHTFTNTVLGSVRYISESVPTFFKNIIDAYCIHNLPWLGPVAEVRFAIRWVAGRQCINTLWLTKGNPYA